MKTWLNLLLATVALTPWTAIHAAKNGPTDAEIAAIVVTANQIDIDAGRLATERARSADVKALAERMVIDHTGVNKSATELVQKLHVTPVASPTSKSLQQEGDNNLANLHRLQGQAFDQAYVAHEVTYHRQVIDALDKTLIPNAQNAELKDLLVKVRPAFVSHLEHAKHVQAGLDERSGK